MEMKSIKTNRSVSYKKRYSIESRHGRVRTVYDDRIVTEDAADARARAESLVMGYVIQRIKVRSYHTHIRPGDIVIVSSPSHNVPANVTKNRFIVERVRTVIDDKTSYDVVEAIRYD
ncbi:MAG: hypothetical protein DRI61_04130 [Chloroflexi bacterium]|nr:MAG: hypothetical protein DRI61_04130 [Chloroflexota bacterium]